MLIATVPHVGKRLHLDPDPEPKLITDPDPNIQIISDPAGSGSTTLLDPDPVSEWGSGSSYLLAQKAKIYYDQQHFFLFFLYTITYMHTITYKWLKFPQLKNFKKHKYSLGAKGSNFWKIPS